MKTLFSTLLICFCTVCYCQVYYYEAFGPFDESIPSPEEFLGYGIGEHHTRHDLMVAYFAELADLSDEASLITYGQTFGKRKLVLLQIATKENLDRQEDIRQAHLNQILSSTSASEELPIIINLGYNVHGNEPSGGEASLLAAYVMVASQHPDIVRYRQESMIFIDPAINPDGRDRHSHWVNMFKGSPLVADPNDVEHNEAWPRGRTNHYWFDLNRDWLLGINPESRGKLTWYHQWYPNVVTDFHEMGTNSTYFFEPMKTNGSKDPIMPEENYITLNDMFAKEFSSDLDAIGSLYFTKEVFDGTYPGYGSSYPDLQGGLGLLFEQASSRGHLQSRPTGEITFPFTIRNQFISSISTVKAAVNNKAYLQDYQRRFFSGAISKAKSSSIKGYVFGDAHDKSLTNAFLDKLLLHKVEVYPLAEDVSVQGHQFKKGSSYYVPTAQHQYRMVQTCFEMYDQFQDSVFYDASAWSLANFYNMPFSATNKLFNTRDKQLENSELAVASTSPFAKSNVAYLSTWNEYNMSGFLYELLDNDIKVNVSQKPFTISSENGEKSFSYGSLIIPVASQDISGDDLYDLLSTTSAKHGIQLHTASSGYSVSGIDLGSRYVDPVTKPKALMITHGSTSGYEAGEVWHLLDQRVGMPITKIPEHRFSRVKLSDYNTLVLVSGNYNELDSNHIAKIKSWLSEGNTLIAQRTAVQWAIRKNLVDAELHKSGTKEEEETSARSKAIRKLYINANEELGKSRIGGMILETELDLSHPLAYGYTRSKLPVYRNSTVFLKPSENGYANVSLYTDDPHIDGFITKKHLEKNVLPSAAIVVSKVGSGRAVLFAENPNFRGSWYGTNKLFLNALFFGDKIRVPD
jgi:hypothetical protein